MEKAWARTFGSRSLKSSSRQSDHVKGSEGGERGDYGGWTRPDPERIGIGQKERRGMFVEARQHVGKEALVMALIMEWWGTVGPDERVVENSLPKGRRMRGASKATGNPDWREEKDSASSLNLRRLAERAGAQWWVVLVGRNEGMKAESS